MLFGSSKSHGDFDGIINTDKNGKVCFKEAYDGAFKERFDKARCVLFEVDPTNFKEDTDFNGEVVSSKPVKVLSRKKIKNIYNELCEAIKEGEFELVEYQKDNPEYVQEIENHIEERMKERKIYNDPDNPMFKFCKKKFPHILERLQKSNKAEASEEQLNMK